MPAPLPKISIPHPEAWQHAIAGISDPLEIAVRILEAGWVALLPTDTVYGLACRPDRPEAAEKIFALKRRPKSSNLPILIGSKGTPDELGLRVDPAAKQLMESPYMPGALTLVLGTIAGKTPEWLEGREEAAVRMPNHEYLLQLIGRTGPICATSANAHGLPTPETIGEILPQLDGMPDVVIDGWTVGVVPSTIVNCRGAVPSIEREWAVPANVIESILS